MRDRSVARDAWSLVAEHVQGGEPPQAHARRGGRRARLRADYGEDQDDWGVVALLRLRLRALPRPENHPFRGVEILKAWGIRVGHARDSLARRLLRRPRETRLEKCCTLRRALGVRDRGGAGASVESIRLDLEASSVIKRMKDKASPAR